jgi:glutamate formiminotransferase/formiminotetrahydrofolate cyclodeaminase
MRPLIQCSPNFSEGRRSEVVDALVDALRAGGVTVLQVRSDPEQNRTVVTLLGGPTAVEAAVVAAAAVAAERIDLEAHTGAHPRIGATDVVPLVPVAGLTMPECVALAGRVGRRLADELNLPVFLYGEAATRPERVSLAAVRDGEYEGLRDAIEADPARAPDFGPTRLGPAGAVAVGARYPRVQLELTLTGARPAVAEQLCAALGETGGGLQHVQAQPLTGDEAAPRLSVLIRRPDLTPVARVVELARREAQRHGAGLQAVALIGHVPQAVLLDSAGWYLGLDALPPEQVLENNVLPEENEPPRVTPEAFVHAVAADAPTPGGGAVAALAGALAAALDTMVTGLTIGRPKYAEVEARMQQVRQQAVEVQAEMLRLMTADSEAFEQVMAAYRLPRGTAEEVEARRDGIQRALRRATEVPLEIMARAVEILRLARACAEHGNANAVSDAGVAGYMALAAAQSASLNVDINILGLRDLEEGDLYRRQSAELLREAHALAEAVDRDVRARIAG